VLTSFGLVRSISIRYRARGEVFAPPALALSVGFRDEVYECDCRSNCGPRVLSLKITKVLVPTVTGPVRRTKLS